jgi:hypothetical protein
MNNKQIVAKYWSAWYGVGSIDNFIKALDEARADERAKLKLRRLKG